MSLLPTNNPTGTLVDDVVVTTTGIWFEPSTPTSQSVAFGEPVLIVGPPGPEGPEGPEGPAGPGLTSIDGGGFGDS